MIIEVLRLNKKIRQLLEDDPKRIKRQLEKNRKKSKVFGVLMVIFLIVGLGGGCVAGYMYRGAGIKEAPEVAPTPEATETPKETIEPTPKVPEEATETPEPEPTEETTGTSEPETTEEPAETPVPTVEPSQDADKNGKKQEKNNINTYTNEQIAEQII